MIVEIVGGPKDGAQIALPDGTHHLRVPVMRNPTEALRWDEMEPPHPALDVRVVDMDIVQMPWGNYAYWREPC